MIAMVRLLSHEHIDRAAALHGAAAASLRDRALGLMERRVHHEALLLAYSDAFLIAGVAMLLCGCGCLLLKRGKSLSPKEPAQ
jgi:DHA2 family multidrug resistance protein